MICPLLIRRPVSPYDKRSWSSFLRFRCYIRSALIKLRWKKGRISLDDNNFAAHSVFATTDFARQLSRELLSEVCGLRLGRRCNYLHDRLYKWAPADQLGDPRWRFSEVAWCHADFWMPEKRQMTGLGCVAVFVAGSWSVSVASGKTSSSSEILNSDSKKVVSSMEKSSWCLWGVSFTGGWICSLLQLHHTR